MECKCICHSNPDIKHVTPCCEKCSNCGANIMIGFMESHLEKCVIYAMDLVTDEEGKLMVVIGEGGKNGTDRSL